MITRVMPGGGFVFKSEETPEEGVTNKAGRGLKQNHATVSSGDFDWCAVLRLVFEHFFQVLQDVFRIHAFRWSKNHLPAVNTSIELRALFVGDVFGR